MKWWFSSQKHGFLALRQKLLALSSSRQTPVEEDNIERTYSPMNRDNFQSIVFLPNSNRGNFVYPEWFIFLKNRFSSHNLLNNLLG